MIIDKGTRLGLANTIKENKILVANVSKSEPVSQGDIRNICYGKPLK